MYFKVKIGFKQLEKHSIYLIYNFRYLSKYSYLFISVDGGWSEWREWSSCDVNCGTGKRSQLRDCTNPFPLNDGKFCKGSNEKIEPCDKGPCPSK